MIKILYLMHIPWRWVKQRPHYIAEQMSGHYEVEVFFRKLYCIEQQLTNDHPPPLRTHEIFVLPLERFDAVWQLNCRIFSFQLRDTISRFDLVWITNPLMFDMVEPVLPLGMKVAYDCMDDALEFPRIKRDVRLRERVGVSERKLAARSDIVFASSQTLKERIAARYDLRKEIDVVTNAMFLGDRDPDPGPTLGIAGTFQSAPCRLTYIGTISEWFDFPLILEALDARKDVTVFLFGPTEVPIPVHDRLVYFGPVEHRHVYRIMAMSDALIMPFRINDLVLGVDPVKLYEYISSGKPVLAVEYPETRKFAEFVYLYNDSADFRELSSRVADKLLTSKMTPGQCAEFAEANTWGERTRFISARLDSLF